jgi:hypothetical protein
VEQIAPSFRQQELEAKTKFARIMLRFHDPIRAARTVQPYDMGLAMRLAQEWEYDPEVLRIREALLDEFGAEHFLPTKADLAREAWKIATGFTMTEEKLKALSLFADVMGHKAKPGGAQEPTGPTVNNTLVLVNPPDDWEDRVKKQQVKVISAS